MAAYGGPRRREDAVPQKSGRDSGGLPEKRIAVEIGGGIRSMDTISAYLEGGASPALSSVRAALKNPDFVCEAVKACGEKIAVGIDARGGKVAAEGWLDTSSVDYIELAGRMEDIGVRTIIFTDIAKDGMLSGPNLEQLEALNRSVSCNIVASGGVSSLVRSLRPARARPVWGHLRPRPLHRDLDLQEALRAAQS